ncbi:MAG: alpha/beta hydrolase family protein, partial [Planctomycetota bacterium]
IGPDGAAVEARLLIPDGDGPFPAVLVTNDGTGEGDLGWQLAQRDFVTLSVDSPEAAQTLSALTYIAANAHTVLAQRPEVYPDRIGIAGQAGAGMWAMLACCMHDKFNCGAWSATKVTSGQYGLRELQQAHALMAPRPFLLVENIPDRSHELSVLNLAVAVNRTRGYRHRVARISYKRHNPVDTVNGPICRFFEWWLHEDMHPAFSRVGGISGYEN